MDMPDSHLGTDRVGRRRKRFLTPAQTYEIWLQLLRGETTIAAAADQAGVDRSTIMKLRLVARAGRPGRAREVQAGPASRRRGPRVDSREGGDRPVRPRRARRWACAFC